MRPVAMLLALVLAASACGGSEPAAEGTPAASTGCEAVETPPLQTGSHLIGDTDPPVPYSSQPPTSGWHTSGPPPSGVHDAGDPLSEPQQVAVLETGGIVITYGGLEDDAVASLSAFAADAGAVEVAVTPYDALSPGEVAVTAWGVLQRCDGVDLAALEAFVGTYADPQPVDDHDD